MDVFDVYENIEQIVALLEHMNVQSNIDYSDLLFVKTMKLFINKFFYYESELWYIRETKVLFSNKSNLTYLFPKNERTFTLDQSIYCAAFFLFNQVCDYAIDEDKWNLFFESELFNTPILKLMDKYDSKRELFF